MIVTDEDVGAALIYLGADPHPLATARFELTKAENEVRETYTDLFLEAMGSNDLRRATAEHDPIYRAAKNAEANAVLELEKQKARVKWAETVIEIWRTENANARAAERVR